MRRSYNTFIVSFRNLRRKKILHSNRRNEISSKYLRLSGVEVESFESWYSWFLSFLPQWFMIPTRIQIHDSRGLLITYWLNDFLRGNLVSFCIFWCSNFCFIPTWYNHSFCLGMECLCNWTLSTRLLEKQADCQPRMHELYRRGRGHVPPGKFFWNLDPRKRHILHSLDRMQLIHTCILLSFSQSLVIHDSRAEVQRFMLLWCFVTMIHDSSSFPED